MNSISVFWSYIFLCRISVLARFRVVGCRFDQNFPILLIFSHGNRRIFSKIPYKGHSVDWTDRWGVVNFRSFLVSILFVLTKQWLLRGISYQWWMVSEKINDCNAQFLFIFALYDERSEKNDFSILTTPPYSPVLHLLYKCRYHFAVAVPTLSSHTSRLSRPFNFRDDFSDANFAVADSFFVDRASRIWFVIWSARIR